MALRRCDSCAQSSSAGRSGDPGTEHAKSWYCNKCWSDWEYADRGAWGGQRNSAAAYHQPVSRPAPAQPVAVSSWSGGWSSASGSSAKPQAQGTEAKQICKACKRSAESGRRATGPGMDANHWFCDACWRSWEAKASKPPAMSSIDKARQAAEDKRLAREAARKAEEEQAARFWAVETGGMKPVVFWGICDLKYDPRLSPRDRVKVLELGDGKSSRFSHHGRVIEEKFKREYCMDREPINRSVMVDNKKFTHDIFARTGFEHLRPKQFCYPRRYEADLARRIANDVRAPPNGSVVLKLVNRSRGAGVVVCPVAELDATLRLLLRPPLHEELEAWLDSRLDIAMREDLTSEILTEQRRHYWSNECPLFVAEQLCHSQPVAMPEAGDGALFDGTMRVAFALRRGGGRNSDSLDIEWLGGYWKLPPAEAAGGDSGSLEEVHQRLVSSFNTEEKRTAVVSDDHLQEVYQALTPAIPKIFEHGALSFQTITDMYKNDPAFFAWAVARLANTYRAADMTKANQTLALAEKHVRSEGQGHDTLPQRSVRSYIERNLGVNYAMLGDWRKANPHFDASIGALPTNATSYYLRGVSLQEDGDFAQAAIFHRKAIVLDPDFRSPCMALGSCLTSLGSYGAAIEACRACLHRQPDAPHAQYTMAQAIYQMLRGGWQGSAEENAALRAQGLQALRVAQRGLPKGQQWLSSDEEKARFLQLEAPKGRQLPVQPLSLWKQPTGWRPQ